MNAPIRVLLVDDHAVVRQGYRSLLHDSGHIDVIGEAADAAGACQAFRQGAPDVVVMDISLPDTSGIIALEHILAEDPRARVLMFSMHEDTIFATRSLDAGARGYITKSSAPETLVEAVLAVADGKKYLGTDIAQALSLEKCSDPANVLQTLTPQEFEILRLSLEGRNSQAIARTLGLSRKSVANYRWSIKQKTGVDNLNRLLPTAMRLGLLKPPGSDMDA